MMALSVVICAHNEQDWITATLESLTRQTRRADEIIVVDNASSDATSQVIQQFIDRHPGDNIKLVHEPKKGLWRARDTGWRTATSDIIASSDADITFPPDWLARIEQQFADPQINAITGTWRYTDALPVVNWTSAWAEENRIKTGQWQLFGANSGIRRKILAEIDGYADKPAEAFEDQYITQKLEAAGYRVEYVREIQVQHTFRRFNAQGLRGYLNYFATEWDGEAIYPDHLSDDSPYTVSVVIPTHNAQQHIGLCLRSLAVQSPLPDEIIVVDVNSTDETHACVTQWIGIVPGIKIVFMEGAHTLQQAREMGRLAASCDLVVQVGADQIFPANWLARIHVAFVCTRQLGAIGGLVRAPAHQLLRYVGRVLRNSSIRRQARTAGYLPENMVAFRRDVVEQICAGGRPRAADWPSGIQRLGYRVRFIPDLFAISQ